MTNTFQFNRSPNSVYESTFTLTGTLHAGTTYWLTIQDGTTNSQGNLLWEVTNGPSMAEHIAGGDAIPGPSESFQIYGNAVPEPSSMALMMLGMAVVAFPVLHTSPTAAPTDRLGTGFHNPVAAGIAEAPETGALPPRLGLQTATIFESGHDN